MKRLILLLLFTASAWAQPLEVQTSQNAGSTLRPLTTQQQATVWGVTPEEWQRYLTLKQQARGVWSPGLDPLTTLGVEAESDHERQRFAELLVRQEYRRLEKELAFQRAYDAAWQRLYPGLTPLKTTSASTSRVSLFVRRTALPATACCVLCWHSSAHWISGSSEAKAMITGCAAGRWRMALTQNW